MPARQRLALRNEAGGIVAAALGRARAAGRRARIFADPDRHRRRARLEIVARRAGDDDVAVPLGGPHAEERLGRDHERTEIERAALDGREPVAVGGDKLTDRFDEQVLGQFWHGEPPGRCGKPRRVRLGPEQGKPAICLAIGLEPLEDFLRIVEHGRCRIEAERLARANLRAVPAATLFPLDRDHMVRKGGAKARIGKNSVANLRAGRRIEGYAGKFKQGFGGCRHGSGHPCRFDIVASMAPHCMKIRPGSRDAPPARAPERDGARTNEKGRSRFAGTALFMVSGRKCRPRSLYRLHSQFSDNAP